MTFRLLLLHTAFLCGVFQVNAQQRKALEGRITDVTVFLQGAQITIQGEASLKAGENAVLLTDLPLEMDPNSVQVEGNPSYTILSVRHQVNHLNDGRRTPRIKALSDSLEDAQFKQKELTALRNVLNQEKALLEANRSMKGNAVLNPDDLEEMADFYAKRFKTVEFKLLELGERDLNLQKEIQRLQNQLKALNARVGQNKSEILIAVNSQRDGKATFKISYFAHSAGWIPVYDLRAEDINTPIEFSYRARVFQSTGTDWNKVNLTLSTGNPSMGGQIPELYPWYIRVYEPVLISAKAETRKPSADTGVMYSADLEESYALNAGRTTASYTTVESNAVNVEFKIGIPYDVPSDNQQYDVTMQRQSLKAEYRYVSIPKLDSDAFLRAQITNWMQYALLPGESHIYFKGTFVGKGFIDPAMASDTLNLSLGRDRSIQVKREQIKDYCKTTSFGSRQKTTRAYEITITNTRKQSVQLEILDQVPISQSSEVEVDVEELLGGTLDPKNGRVSWKFALDPGITVKKQLRFSVKYPKKKYIGNL